MFSFSRSSHRATGMARPLASLSLLLLLVSACFLIKVGSGYDLATVSIDFFDSVDKSPVFVTNFTTAIFTTDLLGFSVLKQTQPFSLGVAGSISFGGSAVTFQDSKSVQISSLLSDIRMSAPEGAVDIFGSSSVVTSRTGDLPITTGINGNFVLEGVNLAVIEAPSLEISAENANEGIEILTQNGAPILFDLSKSSFGMSAMNKLSIQGDTSITVQSEPNSIRIASPIGSRISGGVTSLTSFSDLKMTSTQAGVFLQANSFSGVSNGDLTTQATNLLIFETLTGNIEVSTPGPVLSATKGIISLLGSSITVQANGDSDIFFFSQRPISFSCLDFSNTGTSLIQLNSNDNLELTSQTQTNIGNLANWVSNNEFNILTTEDFTFLTNFGNFFVESDIIFTANTFNFLPSTISILAINNHRIIATNQVSFTISQPYTIGANDYTLNSGRSIYFTSTNDQSLGPGAFSVISHATDEVILRSNTQLSFNMISSVSLNANGNLELLPTTSLSFTTVGDQNFNIFNQLSWANGFLAAPSVNFNSPADLNWHTDATATLNFNSITVFTDISTRYSTPTITLQAAGDFSANTAVFNVTSAQVNQQLSFSSTSDLELASANLLVSSNNAISVVGPTIAITTERARVNADLMQLSSGSLSVQSNVADILVGENASFVATKSISLTLTDSLSLSSINRAGSYLEISTSGSQTYLGTSEINIRSNGPQQFVATDISLTGASVGISSTYSSLVGYFGDAFSVSAGGSFGVITPSGYVEFSSVNDFNATSQSLVFNSVGDSIIDTINSINIIANDQQNGSTNEELNFEAGNNLVFNANQFAIIAPDFLANSNINLVDQTGDFEITVAVTSNVTPFLVKYVGSTSLTLDAEFIDFQPFFSEFRSLSGGGVSMSTERFNNLIAGPLSVSSDRNFAAVSKQGSISLTGQTSRFNGQSVNGISKLSSIFLADTDISLSSGNQRDVTIYSSGAFSSQARNLDIFSIVADPLDNSGATLDALQGNVCLNSVGATSLSALQNINIKAIGENGFVDIGAVSTISVNAQIAGILVRSDGFGFDPNNLILQPYGILVNSAQNLLLNSDIGPISFDSQNLNFTSPLLAVAGGSIRLISTLYESNVNVQAFGGPLGISSSTDVTIYAGTNSFAASLLLNSTSTAQLSSGLTLQISQLGTTPLNSGGVTLLGLRGDISVNAANTILIGYSSGGDVSLTSLNNQFVAFGANVNVASNGARIIVRGDTGVSLSTNTNFQALASGNGGSLLVSSSRSSPISITSTGAALPISFSSLTAMFNGTTGNFMKASTNFIQNARCISMLSAGLLDLISTSTLSMQSFGDTNLAAVTTLSIDSPQFFTTNIPGTGLVRINAGSNTDGDGIYVNSIGSIVIGNTGGSGTLETLISANVVNVVSNSQVVANADNIFISAFGRNGAGDDILLQAQQGPISLNANQRSVLINSIESTKITTGTTALFLAQAGSITTQAARTQNWVSSIITVTSKTVSLQAAQIDLSPTASLQFTQNSAGGTFSVSSASSLLVSTLVDTRPITITTGTTFTASTPGSSSPITFDAQQSVTTLTAPTQSFTAGNTLVLDGPQGVSITATTASIQTTSGSLTIFGQPIQVSSGASIAVVAPTIQLSSQGSLSLSSGTSLLLSATNSITSTSDINQTFKATTSIVLGSAALSTLTVTSLNDISLSSGQITLNNGGAGKLTFAQIGNLGDRPNGQGIIINTGTSQWQVTASSAIQLRSASSIEFVGTQFSATLTNALTTNSQTVYLSSAGATTILAPTSLTQLSAPRQLSLTSLSTLSISSTGLISITSKSSAITFNSNAALTLASTTSDAVFIANPNGSVRDGTITFTASNLDTNAATTSIRAADEIIMQAVAISLSSDTTSIRSQISTSISAVDVSLATDALTVNANDAIRFSSSETFIQATTATLTAQGSFTQKADFVDFTATTIDFTAANQLFVNSDLIISTNGVLSLSSTGTINLGTFDNFGTIEATSFTGDAFQLTTNNVLVSAGKSININSIPSFSVTNSFSIQAPNSIKLGLVFPTVKVNANALFQTSSATADFSVDIWSTIQLKSTGALSMSTQASLGQYDADSINTVSRYSDDGIQFISDNGDLSLSASGDVSIRSVNGDVIFGARRAINYDVTKIAFFGQTPSKQLTNLLSGFIDNDYCSPSSGLVQCVTLTTSIRLVASALEAYGFIS